MTVRLYQSTDGDAPKLSAEPSKLVQVLEACLVTGYGSKPGLGWEIDRLDDHTRAAMRSTDPGATGCWLLIDDDSPEASARWAHCMGLEQDAWGGFDGAGLPQITGRRFPLESQTAWGSTWAKSRTEDTTARPWVLVADARMFYLFVTTDSGVFGASGSNYAPFPMGFGDIVAYKPADVFACTLIGDFEHSGSSSTNVLNAGHPHFGIRHGGTSIGWHKRTRRAFARSLDAGDPVPWAWQRGLVAQTSLSIGGLTYPHPPEDGLIAVPGLSLEGNFLRGSVPGIYLPEHPEGTITDLQLVDNVIGAEGRTFLGVRATRQVGTFFHVEFLIDITGPWR